MVKSRWKCRTCGNSALFVFSVTTEQAQLWSWADRGYGYVPLGEPVTRSIKIKQHARPDYCWVCKSKDIGYAYLTEGEQGAEKRKKHG